MPVDVCPTTAAAAEVTPGVNPPACLDPSLLSRDRYIGIYLCRKNFSVANPLIRQALGLNKEQIGEVASYSTMAYMIGKFVFGPVIDRVGGRSVFLLSLFGVAVLAQWAGSFIPCQC